MSIQKDLKMATSIAANLSAWRTRLMVGTISMGNGSGTGYGLGERRWHGPGSGGNTGGGPSGRIGGGVSAPIPIVIAGRPGVLRRSAKGQGGMGNVLVEPVGGPERAIPAMCGCCAAAGMGLDEKAIEAVKQYRFKPAMENGKPVTGGVERRGELPDLLAMV